MFFFGFNPQPDPPPKEGASQDFNPQPDPPREITSGIQQSGASQDFNPQPDPPREITSGIQQSELVFGTYDNKTHGELNASQFVIKYTHLMSKLLPNQLFNDQSVQGIQFWNMGQITISFDSETSFQFCVQDLHPGTYKFNHDFTPKPETGGRKIKEGSQNDFVISRGHLYNGSFGFNNISNLTVTSLPINSSALNVFTLATQ